MGLLSPHRQVRRHRGEERSFHHALEGEKPTSHVRSLGEGEVGDVELGLKVAD